jgi:cytochrome c
MTAAVCATVTLTAVAACSKHPTSSDATSADAASTTPASSAQSTTSADTSATAAAPAAGATPVKLDIKDASGVQVSGDPVQGKSVFVQCQTCHTTQAGVNKVGPSLHGIIGRHSGAVPGFNYSTANKGSGIVWTEQELWVYLENPQKTVPGTYMTFTGIKDPQKRADVIAYLQENTN